MGEAGLAHPVYPGKSPDFETAPEGHNVEILRQILPFLIPIALLQLALIVVALIDLARRERTRGPKWVWVLIIVLINFIGPIVYFVVGRDE